MITLYPPSSQCWGPCMQVHHPPSLSCQLAAVLPLDLYKNMAVWHLFLSSFCVIRRKETESINVPLWRFPGSPHGLYSQLLLANFPKNSSPKSTHMPGRHVFNTACQTRLPLATVLKASTPRRMNERQMAHLKCCHPFQTAFPQKIRGRWRGENNRHWI